MAFDSVHGFLEGISGTISRSVVGYAIISLSSTFAFALVARYFDLLSFIIWPLYLFGSVTRWGNFVVISIPLLGVLAGVFVYCLREGFGRHTVFAMAALPYLLICIPDWYYAPLEMTFVSIFLFIAFVCAYWIPMKFRKPE